MVNVNAQMLEDIKTQLENLGVKVDSVETCEVQKENGIVAHGVRVIKKDTNLHPTVYIDNVPEDEIVSYVVNVAKEEAPAANLDILKDKDKLLENVLPNLINKENNTELLKEAISKPFLDMVVTYRIDVGAGTILVKKDFAEHFDISLDELHDAAVQNIRKKKLIGDVATVMGVMGNLVPDSPFTILTIKSKCRGAAIVLDNETLKEHLDGDCYILPSSIHEMLAVPFNNTECDADELRELVKSINSNEVEPAERLSDSVYIWKDGELSIAE